MSQENRAKALTKLEDLELSGRVCFVRVDFNVPLNPDRSIADDTRITAALPTIQFLREKGARLVLASHLGRPKGKPDPDQSLEPAAQRLAEILNIDVVLADDCIGDGVRKNIRDLRGGDVLVLENLRFHREEEANDEAFAHALATGIDVYINDAFGAAHRAHASTVGMVRWVRDRAPGFLMRKELEVLGRLLEDPDRPFVAILGGAKVSDKIGVLQSLLSRADAILIGGAMAYTLLKARGVEVGKSRVEHDNIAVAEQFLKSAQARKVQVLLPEDHVVAELFNEDAPAQTVSLIPQEAMGLDIGPKTAQRFQRAIMEAKTVLWNGPMGVFEWPAFSHGTKIVAHAMAETKATTVVGGGDSVAALHLVGVASRIDHVSTGGGASLEFLEGKVLPGVKALGV